ncbi:MAG: stage 0 sporulation family protein [Clostridia bacterium]|nr:stage 0 sporulation family protein [Clostridia bacterium]
MTKVVGIKFKNGGKLYYFTPKTGEVYQRNTPVIVETSRGVEYAWVAYPEREIDDSEIVSPLKPILRIATDKDTEKYQAFEAKKPEAIRICKEKIAARELEMKLVDCEFSFDSGKITFFFTSESRVDFRELVKDLAAAFHTRIDLRQVGIRDETKYLGGIAPCGRVCCCAGNMPEFKKVSVKMAKAQNLSLNPGKISGLCGRLMCCLGYEIDYYVDAAKQLPKVGAEVGTPEGKAIVVSLNMLKMEVRVKMDDKNGGWIFKDYPASELQFKKPCAECKKQQECHSDDEELETDNG